MSLDQATGDNVGPAINVVTWFLTVVTVLAVIARIATKRVLSSLGIDDALILVALIPSIAIAGIVAVETANGLGQHTIVLSEGQLQIFQKTAYAYGLLYIFVVAVSKVSILFFLRGLTPVAQHRLVINILLCMVAIWGVSGFVAAAVPCAPPSVWEILVPSRCFDIEAFWNYHNASNILLELTVIILPIIIVVRLNTSISAKVLVISCFSTRILVVGALISELILRSTSFSNTDQTFTTWSTAMSSEFVQAFSIITACIPYLKPFLASLQTGMIRTDDLKRRNGNVKGHYTISVPEGLRFSGTDSNGKSKTRNPLGDVSRQNSALPLENRKSSKMQSEEDIEIQNVGVQWDAESHASTRMMISRSKDYDSYNCEPSSSGIRSGSSHANTHSA